MLIIFSILLLTGWFILHDLDQTNLDGWLLPKNHRRHQMKHVAACLPWSLMLSLTLDSPAVYARFSAESDSAQLTTNHIAFQFAKEKWLIPTGQTNRFKTYRNRHVEFSCNPHDLPKNDFYFNRQSFLGIQKHAGCMCIQRIHILRPGQCHEVLRIWWWDAVLWIRKTHRVTWQQVLALGEREEDETGRETQSH